MSEDNYRFSGISRLYGEQASLALSHSHVCVVGVGGVGSWSVEALVRSGVGEITIVDLDDICITNVNRQLHAMDSTVGKLKIDVLKERSKQINPNVKINTIADFLTKKTVKDILSTEYSYIIDAIDSLENKATLVVEARKKNIPIITVGGAGGKQDATKVLIEDLSKSWNDRLLQRLRKTLRKEFGYPKDGSPFNIKCVFSHELPFVPQEDGSVFQMKNEEHRSTRLDCHSGYGSATFITGTIGFIAAGEVVKDLCRV